jgi:hypothetical protein
LLTGGLNRWLFSSIQLFRLTGGCTAGAALVVDDFGLESVTVAITQPICVGAQRQPA